MRTSIAPTETNAGPVKSKARQDESGAGLERPDSHDEEIEALKRSLREQRRATTLLNAEVQKQTEAREAVEAQLIEANAEIAASWERRKEMTRVIADRDAKLAEANSRLRQADEMERELAELRSEIKASRERRKEIARVVANRDAKISQLKADLQARYGELAALQRHISRSSLSGRTKRLVRPVTRLLGK